MLDLFLTAASGSDQSTQARLRRIMNNSAGSQFTLRSGEMTGDVSCRGNSCGFTHLLKNKTQLKQIPVLRDIYR